MTLPIAKRIAGQSARTSGIVHRDLKPAVKVRPGIVKCWTSVGEGPRTGVRRKHRRRDIADDYLAGDVGQLGVILGGGYAGPEQAKGRAADKRSDVWAFGCVLYEMLTGMRVQAENVSQALATVLRDEPDWTALPADLSLSMRTSSSSASVDRTRQVRDIAIARFVSTSQRLPHCPPAMARLLFHSLVGHELQPSGVLPRMRLPPFWHPR